MLNIARYPALLAAFLFLLACAGTREMKLTPIPETIPPDISLEGRWELSDDGDAARKVREAEQRVAGSVSDALAPSRQEKSGRSREKTSARVSLKSLIFSHTR